MRENVCDKERKLDVNEWSEMMISRMMEENSTIGEEIFGSNGGC